MLVSDSTAMLSTCRDAILHASFIWSWHFAVLRQSSRRNGLCPVQGPMHGQDVYWCDGDIPRASNARTGKYAPTILLVTSWAPVACQYARLTCPMRDLSVSQALNCQSTPIGSR